MQFCTSFYCRYQFSEIIDSQLKQISDDLKEIIEHINESNKDDEVANPVSCSLKLSVHILYF